MVLLHHAMLAALLQKVEALKWGGPGGPGEGRAEGPGPPPSQPALWRGTAACVHRTGPDQFAGHPPGGRTHGEPGRGDDIFDTGHGSVSLSFAAGLVAAKDLKGGSENVIAVIGDGAFTGGLSFETLNNLG